MGSPVVTQASRICKGKIEEVSENLIMGRKALNHGVFGCNEVIQDMLPYDFQVGDGPLLVG